MIGSFPRLQETHRIVFKLLTLMRFNAAPEGKTLAATY